MDDLKELTDEQVLEIMLKEEEKSNQGGDSNIGDNTSQTPPVQEFEKNPLFDLIGERTKAEQDLIDRGSKPTLEELNDSPEAPMTIEELYDYADMLVDAWTMGMVMIARGISMNQMTESQLSPTKERLKSLKKVVTKVMFKYQQKTPLLFLFFLTLVLVYFPAFRESWIARKEFKNRLPKRQPDESPERKAPMMVNQKKKDEKKEKEKPVKIPYVTDAQERAAEQAEKDPAKEAMIDLVAENTLKEMKSAGRGTKSPIGRKKKGFQFS